MNEELRELIERLEKAGLENEMNPGLSAEKKEQVARRVRRFAEIQASFIMNGRRLKEQEDRFRRALGMRLKTPRLPGGK